MRIIRPEPDLTKSYYNRMIFFQSKYLNFGLCIGIGNELWYTTDPHGEKNKHIIQLNVQNTETLALVSLIILHINLKIIWTK